MNYYMRSSEFFKIASLRKINGNALMRPSYIKQLIRLLSMKFVFGFVLSYQENFSGDKSFYDETCVIS
jgi:hypothetical protein